MLSGDIVRSCVLFQNMLEDIAGGAEEKELCLLSECRPGVACLVKYVKSRSETAAVEGEPSHIVTLKEMPPASIWEVMDIANYLECTRVTEDIVDYFSRMIMDPKVPIQTIRANLGEIYDFDVAEENEILGAVNGQALAMSCGTPKIGLFPIPPRPSMVEKSLDEKSPPAKRKITLDIDDKQSHSSSVNLDKSPLSKRQKTNL